MKHPFTPGPTKLMSKSYSTHPKYLQIINSPPYVPPVTATEKVRSVPQSVLDSGLSRVSGRGWMPLSVRTREDGDSDSEDEDEPVHVRHDAVEQDIGDVDSQDDGGSFYDTSSVSGSRDSIVSEAVDEQVDQLLGAEV